MSLFDFNMFGTRNPMTKRETSGDLNMPGISDLAAKAFEKRERVKMLEMMNTPIDYEERKKAFIALELARAESNNADRALRQLNPFQG